MEPTTSDVHVNGPLTNISIAFMQGEDAFIANKVFPNIPVTKQSDLYFTYDRGEFNRDDMKERAPGTEAEGGGYTMNADASYYARQYSFKHDIPDPVRANADVPHNPDRAATMFVSRKGLIRRERIFATNYFSTGLWTYGKVGASSASGTDVKYWSDTTSTPITDVRLGKQRVLESTGFEPNTLILGRKVYDVLCDHPSFLDRIKYGQDNAVPARVTRAAMAQLFEVDNVYVMNAIYNTAAKGQTASHSFIGGNHALLMYVTPTPDIMTPTAGYTFSWTGMFGNSQLGTRIRQYRMESIQSDRVEIDMCFDLKLVSADLGYFFTSVIQ
jgi:hypothetical protein